MAIQGHPLGRYGGFILEDGEAILGKKSDHSTRFARSNPDFSELVARYAHHSLYTLLLGFP